MYEGKYSNRRGFHGHWIFDHIVSGDRRGEKIIKIGNERAYWLNIFTFGWVIAQVDGELYLNSTHTHSLYLLGRFDTILMLNFANTNFRRCARVCVYSSLCLQTVWLDRLPSNYGYYWRWASNTHENTKSIYAWENHINELELAQTFIRMTRFEWDEWDEYIVCEIAPNILCRRNQIHTVY